MPNKLTIETNGSIDISPADVRNNKLEILDTRRGLTVRSVPIESPPPVDPPPVEPPPDPDPIPEPPKPGAIVFAETFEKVPGLWKMLVGLFTLGNTKVHPEPGKDPVPVPIEMGAGSLRMEHDDPADRAPGKFPVGESDTISLDIQLQPGLYLAKVWGVAHDSGEFAVEALEGGDTLGGLYGSDGWTPYEWLAREFPFETLTGNFDLAVSYTAPPLDMPSGIKIALITIEVLE